MELPADQPVIIFDGVCNFCDRSVRFVMDRDPSQRFRFASNQSEAGSALLSRFGIVPGGIDSVFLVEGERIWSKSRAALEIARRMPWPWKAVYSGVVVPRFLRDWVYDMIARNRYRFFGKADSCRLPREGERERFLS